MCLASPPQEFQTSEFNYHKIQLPSWIHQWYCLQNTIPGLQFFMHGIHTFMEFASNLSSPTKKKPSFGCDL